MIPKLIHYVWLSGDEMPEKTQQCIASWKKYLPDYEFMLWDTKRFDLKQSKWVRQSFELKKYAFATDYIRFYALYNYGGIYLDTDVEVLKSYDDLLTLPYFVGKEDTNFGFEAATIGAEAHNPWIKKCLDYYEGRPFVLKLGVYDDKVLPSIMHDLLIPEYTINDIESAEDFKDEEFVLNRFPLDFFSPKTWSTGEIHKTERTYSIHHFSGSWVNNYNKAELFRRNVLNPMQIWLGARKLELKKLLHLC